MLSKKHQKEMVSFRKKLGKHIFWFDSLTDKSRNDILFKYKSEKHIFKKWFSHFPFASRIHSYKKMFRSTKHRIRDMKLEKLLK